MADETRFDFRPLDASLHSGGVGRGLWSLADGFRGALIAGSLLLAAATALKTSTYLIVRYYVDEVLGPGNSSGDPRVVLVPVGFLLVAAIGGVCTLWAGRLSAHGAEGLTLRLRNFLFDHLQRLAFEDRDAHSTGDLVQRASSDVEAVRKLFAEHLTGFSRVLFLLIVNLTALIRIEPGLALGSLPFIPVVVVISILFFPRIAKAYERFQKQESTLTAVLQENLSGIRVVKAFARGPFEVERWRAESRKKYRLGLTLTRRHALYWPVTDILCSAQLIAGLLFAADLALSGSISVGSFLAYAGIIVWIVWPVRDVGELVVKLSRGFVSYRRLAELITTVPERLHEGEAGTEVPEIRGAVEMIDVRFEYPNGTVALNGIDLSCRPGEIVALLGPAGSGKTSLVNLLPRFYDPSSGEITIDGTPITTIPRAALRETIGIVEQEPFLFSVSIRDNIAYGVPGEIADATIQRAARAARIHDVISGFPDGYDTMVGERGVSLSGGQRQRIAIARTLLRDPRILILDDSTSSVDLETEAGIWEALDELMRGRTTFIIAHRIASLRRADQILVLDAGRTVQRGRHEELIRAAGLYREIYDLQRSVSADAPGAHEGVVS